MVILVGESCARGYAMGDTGSCSFRALPTAIAARSSRNGCRLGPALGILLVKCRGAFAVSKTATPASIGSSGVIASIVIIVIVSVGGQRHAGLAGGFGYGARPRPGSTTAGPCRRKGAFWEKVEEVVERLDQIPCRALLDDPFRGSIVEVLNNDVDSYTAALPAEAMAEVGRHDDERMAAAATAAAVTMRSFIVVRTRRDVVAVK